MRPSLGGTEFGSFGNRVWFNCAHQGPLPGAAVTVAQAALRQKMMPYLISDDDFARVPRTLKTSLAQLIGAGPDDIILGNSASYGLHILRNGLSWRSGDEVLVVDGDFPATIYPWMDLPTQGVLVRFLKTHGQWLTTEELAQAITPATRALAISWVNSFNGSVLDLNSIGNLCRERNVIFILNGSQGVGALPVDVRQGSLDALVCCGYKWLCGPYSTGFCWIRPELRSELRPSQLYWLPNVWGQEHLTDYRPKPGLGSRAFDVFCTANFLNFLPWQASVDLLLRIRISEIHQHNRELTLQLVNGFDPSKYRLVSPSDETRMSAIVVMTHHQPHRNREIYQLLADSGIDIALRAGNLRFSIHLYNNSDEVQTALGVLNSVR